MLYLIYCIKQNDDADNLSIENEVTYVEPGNENDAGESVATVSTNLSIEPFNEELHTRLFESSDAKDCLIDQRKEKLTPDEKNSVDAALTSVSDDRQDEVLVQKIEIPIKREDMARLNDGEWLNDEVI